MRSTILGVTLLPFLCSAQSIDSIRFHSSAFGMERTVVVRTPEFHRYASAEVRLPVIILLDGQHDWFVDPLVNDIRFLEFTHEVPQCIVVTVPLKDRVNELGQDSIDQPTMPLLELLTKELPPLLAHYHPSDLTILVGHSFGASFSLFALLKAPDAFDAIIALSPLHQMPLLAPLVATELEKSTNKRVYVALGGAERLKDGGHFDRVAPVMHGLDRTRIGDQLVYREYPSAGHTSLPIIAFPDLLATLFTPYSIRDSLCPVNDEYELITAPPSPAELMRDVEASHEFLGSTIPWDVAEINGSASRLLNSGYNEHALAVYQRGIQLYPKLYEFHWSVGELLLESDRQAGLVALNEALSLLEREEATMPDREAVRAEIRSLMK